MSKHHVEQWDEDYLRTMRDSMPLVRDPSGGSARMSLSTNKIDCVALLEGGLTRGYPYVGEDWKETWRDR